MSLNTIERIFWEFGEHPEKVQAYLKAPDAYLAQFPLTDAERKMVRTMDVKALDGYGVSNMLTMLAYTVVNGYNELLMFDYLKKMNDGKMINRMRLPGWQFSGLSLALAVRNAWVGLLGTLGLKKRLS